MIGPAWSGRGATPPGCYTKRGAEEWLQAQLRDIQLGVAAGLVETGATFADAAAEYLRYAEQDRGCKPSTIRGYRSAIHTHLLPAFGKRRVEDITAKDIERWRAGLIPGRKQAEGLKNKTKNNLLVLLHAIFRRAVKFYGLPFNPVDNVDRFRVRSSGDIEVFSPEEVWSLVRAAKDELDATIYLTAAFTGLRRGEILALRWRDVDFPASTIRVRASYSAGQADDAQVRQGPIGADGSRRATAIAKLGQREEFVSDDDYVFANGFGDADRWRRSIRPLQEGT